MRIIHQKSVPIVERIACLEQWMRQYGSYAVIEQRHLYKDSVERAYWNYGYLMALREALALVTDQDSNSNADGLGDSGSMRDTSRTFR